jgi:hypothetical protein
MSIDILGRNLIYFAVLILLQILIFNNIGISSMDVIPAYFILFVLLLPFEMPKWLILLLSFFLGIIIDIFSDTSGLSASSTVFIAFLRPVVLQYLSPRGGYDTGAAPRITYLGVPWFIKYSFTMIGIHQFVFYFLENFGFQNFKEVILKVILGTLFTFILILISQFVLFRKL